MRRIPLVLAGLLLMAGGCREPAAPARPDVFVVMVDTLRADVLSTWNPDLPIGDSIRELAADGLVFERLRSSSSWTRASVASLLTGQTVFSHGVFNRRDRLAARHETLATILDTEGYRTHAWSTNPNILGIWGFDRGFDGFTDLPPQSLVRGAMEGSDVVDRVIEDIDAHPEEPLFHYVHLSDPHVPLVPGRDDLEAIRALGDRVQRTFPGDPSGPRMTKLSEDDYPRYLAEVRDVDRAIGRLIAALKERGRYEGALILLVSDHGEEFGDHSGLGHGRTLYEEVLHVPGILKLPGGRAAGRRLASDVELYDLLPTVLSALGIEWSGTTQGRDVLASLDTPPEQVEPGAGFYALTLDGQRQTAIRLGRYKLIHNHRSGGRWLFDLEQDPKEREDLAARLPDVVARLQGVLDLMQAVDEPGWHVRACGCLEERDVRFALSAAEPPARDPSLEEDDRIDWDEASRTARIHWRLSPSRERRANGMLESRADNDGLVIPTASGTETAASASAGPPVRLEPSADAPLDIAFGNGERRPFDTKIPLDDSLDEARVEPTERVVCEPEDSIWTRPRGAACTPHLRVWSVPGSESVSTDEVPEEMRERLRALGYSW